MAEIVSRRALAAFTRAEVVLHDEWDSLHSFRSLHNVDGKIAGGIYVIIDPASDTDGYPAIIEAMAMRSLELDDLPPPCAFLLQHEAWMGILPENASRADQERLEHDAESHLIHARPDRIEIATAMCADVHGRVYMAIKRRDTGEITESFQSPLSASPTQAGGRFVRAMLSAAYAAGAACWNLPHPTGLN